MAMADFFDRGWRQAPHATAYVRGERRWSFEEAGLVSRRVGHALLEAGIGRGGKAAVLSPNDPVAWMCVLGLWRAGLVWVPLNPAQPPAELRGLIDGFDCEVLFFDESLAGVVEEIWPDLPKLRQLVCIGESTLADAPGLDEWVAGQPASEPQVERDPDDVVAISPTGGTTGLPKGVMHTNRTFSVAFAHLMLACSYRADEPVVNLAAGPLGTGILSMPVSARGGTVVTLERPEPTAVLDAIEEHRVTELVLPPTVIYRLLETPGVQERDFSSLRYMLYAAASMSTEKLRRAIAVFGPVMMEAYGQVEAFGVSYFRPEEHYSDGEIVPDSRLASCGRPYPLVSVEVRDQDDLPVGSGMPGEICVRGDLVMKGYYKAPEQTAQTIIDGWLHTGDIGHLDEHGYLFVTGRKRDMIISGGFNIYPSEVEQVIWGHPAVQECAVIGVPDEDWGEAVKAIVELNPGGEASESELIELCTQRLDDIRAPKSIDFVESLPRSPSGKVLKKDLRETYRAGQAQRV